jgi:hypothetical protein
MSDTQPTIIADAMIGRAIGNYVVRRMLGQGGMGTVYFAEHPGIGKRVALKVLHAEFASQPEIVNRFFHEAKAVNDIQHPNIVDIIDFGTLPPPSPADPPIVYFFMEYLEGTSLTDLLRRESPLPCPRAMAIALQIADALAASHRTGIIHRDLKSDNVMLVSRQQQDFVKLLDFGIAKMVGNSTSSQRTRTGIVMGTPQYMSPEQCEGRSTIDHRTDIYALGIVLYQMLTGRVPFYGDSFGEVLVQQMAIPPLAPSLIAPQISAHLEQVVLKALEKRAEHRYARMEDMILALRDPVPYVEARGGCAGFLVSPVLRDPALVGSRAAMVMFATGQPVSTTLGGSAAQTAAQTAAPARSRTARTIKIGLAAGVVAILAIGLAVTARQDRPATAPGGSAAQVAASDPAAASPTASAQPAAAPAPPAAAAPSPSAAPQPSPPTTTAPAVATTAATAPSTTTAPAPSTTAQPSPPAATSQRLPPQPAVTPGDPPSQAAAPLGVRPISITIESTPSGARVFVDGESTARGTTPYVLERAPDATPAEVRLVLAGYRPLKRSIELDRDRKLRFALDRLAGPASPVARPDRPAGPAPAAAKPDRPAGPGSAAARPDRTTTEHDDSDDPMDPFAKKKKEGP